MSACTGLTAVWCPIHGDCICPVSHEHPAHESGTEPHMADDLCPLHSPESDHPDGERLTLCAVCFTMKNIKHPSIVCARCAVTEVEGDGHDGDER